MNNLTYNIFYCSSNCQKDLDRIYEVLSKEYNALINSDENCIDAEFESVGTFNQDIKDKLKSIVENPSSMYIRVLSFCLEDEYASLNILKNGLWILKQPN